MTRCAYCNAKAPLIMTAGVFCSKECAQNHRAFDCVLIEVDASLADRVGSYSRDAGAGFKATWEMLFRAVLDRAGAPIGG